MRRLTALFIAALIAVAGGAEAGPAKWAAGDWPHTNFTKHSVPLGEIMSGGVGKDGIPPVDEPEFENVEAAAARVSPQEPVVSLSVNGAAKAYPLSILIWHEIVNDEIGGVPVAVTFCPLCNAAIVYDRRVNGRTLDFGVTGKLRKSDLVMWDRQTESWWQQFLGEAIVGELTGARLNVIASRVESFERFAGRRPDGLCLRPTYPQLRAYGRNPYVRYDSAPWPFLYRGESPEGIAPLARVVAVGDVAWSMDLLRKRGMVKHGSYAISWSPGQASALDAADIADGRDIGNIVVQEMGPKGPVDAPHSIAFVFAYHAFRPKGVIHVDCDGGRKPARPLKCG